MDKDFVFFISSMSHVKSLWVICDFQEIPNGNENCFLLYCVLGGELYWEMRTVSYCIAYWVAIASLFDLFIKLIGGSYYDYFDDHVVARFNGIMTFLEIDLRIQMVDKNF
ncbi:unnamed protein product, partial [Mesorhabditis belari]|uniref:Uncharacterized protein n=1 Tax=Mesorhabditis belari TaxID=2138241 RepID=A0AAF3J871_9BILA